MKAKKSNLKKRDKEFDSSPKKIYQLKKLPLKMYSSLISSEKLKIKANLFG